MQRLLNPMPFCLISALCGGLAGPTAFAQARSRQGFETTADAKVSGEEQSAQPSLWVMEVRYKSLRMMPVVLTDPQTGRKTREFVWYLVFRAYHRPRTAPSDPSDTTPQNSFDPEHSPPVFAPEFTLIGRLNKDSPPRIYPDVILPEAQAAVMRREGLQLKNPVELVGPLPPVTKPGETLTPNVIEGVAIWRGIDPKTDFFTIFMSGFSNGYRRVRKGAAGTEELLERKTLVQEYWRPGDAIDLDESEFRQQGEPRWVFRPDATPPPPLGRLAQSKPAPAAKPPGDKPKSSPAPQPKEPAPQPKEPAPAAKPPGEREKGTGLFCANSCRNGPKGA